MLPMFLHCAPHDKDVALSKQELVTVVSNAAGLDACVYTDGRPSRAVRTVPLYRTTLYVFGHTHAHTTPCPCGS